MENLHLSLFRSLSVGSFKEHRLAFQLSAPTPFANDAEMTDAKNKLLEEIDSPEASTPAVKAKAEVFKIKAALTTGGGAVVTEIETRMAAREKADADLSTLKTKNADALKSVTEEIVKPEPAKTAAVTKAKGEIATAMTLLEKFADKTSAEFKLSTRTATVEELKTHVAKLVDVADKAGVKLLDNPFSAEKGETKDSKIALSKAYLRAEGVAIDAAGTTATLEKDGVKVVYKWDDATAKWAPDLTAGVAVPALQADGTFKLDEAVLTADPKKLAVATKHNAILGNINELAKPVTVPPTALDAAKLTGIVNKANEGAKTKATDMLKKYADAQAAFETTLIPLIKDFNDAKASRLEGPIKRTGDAIKEAAKNRKLAVWDDMKALTKESPLPFNTVAQIDALNKQLFDTTKIVSDQGLGAAPVAPTTTPTVVPPVAPVLPSVVPPAAAIDTVKVNEIPVDAAARSVFDAVNADPAKKMDSPAVVNALKTVTDNDKYKALPNLASKEAVAARLLTAIKALDTGATKLFDKKIVKVDATTSVMTIVDAPVVAPVAPTGAAPEASETRLMTVLNKILEFLQKFLLPAIKEGNANTLKQMREENKALMQKLDQLNLNGGRPQVGIPRDQIPANMAPFYRPLPGRPGMPIMYAPQAGLFQARIDGNNVILSQFDGLNSELNPFGTVLQENGTMLVNNPNSLPFVVRTLDGRRMICRRRLQGPVTGPVKVEVNLVKNEYNITQVTNVTGNNTVVQNNGLRGAPVVTRQETGPVAPAPVVRPVEPLPVAPAPTPTIPVIRPPEAPRPTPIVPPPAPVIVPVAPPVAPIVPPTIVPPVVPTTGSLPVTGDMLPPPPEKKK